MNGNVPSLPKYKIVKKDVIEDVEEGVDGLSDSYFSKAAARLFDKIDNGNPGVLP